MQTKNNEPITAPEPAQRWQKYSKITITNEIYEQLKIYAAADGRSVKNFVEQWVQSLAEK